MQQRVRNDVRDPRSHEAMSRLAEQLVHEAAETAPNAREILLDIEIDGLRCVVARAPKAPQEALSPREQEIARLIADGHPNKTIAAILEISTWTVNTHLRRIFAKLGVTSRAAMVAKLMR